MGNGKTIPPLAPDEARERMRTDPTCRSYLYVGAEEDEGWQCALDAENLLPRLDIYRADSPAGLWFEIEPRGGAVFGFGDDLRAVLDPATAARMEEVVQAISHGASDGEGGGE